MLITLLAFNSDVFASGGCGTSIVVNSYAIQNNQPTSSEFATYEDLEIVMTTSLSGTSDITIDFGDGTTLVIPYADFTTNINSHQGRAVIHHTYTAAGIYSLTFGGALCGEFQINISASRECCENTSLELISPTGGEDIPFTHCSNVHICNNQPIVIGITSGCDINSPGVQIQSISWIVTDASGLVVLTDNAAVFNHSFSTPGSYKINCTVVYTTNSGVCNTSNINGTPLTLEGHITVTGAPPVAIQGPFGVCEPDAVFFQLGGTTADVSSVDWDFGDHTYGTGFDVTHTFSSSNSYTVSCTVSSSISGCADTIVSIPVVVQYLDFSILNSGNNCANFPQYFSPSVTDGNPMYFVWDFGDPSSPNNTSGDPSPSHIFSSPGTYTVTCVGYVNASGECAVTRQVTITINDCQEPCENCIGSFSPLPGRRYVLSAWVSEQSYHNKTLFTEPEIYLDFANGTPTTLGPFKPKAGKPIIDGWQQIEEPFTIPATATEIKVRFVNSSTEKVYFDDLRIYPFDGTLKSFVYDPVSLKLVAELDERNFATFYEYDSEGNLVRVKKETEKGIMTIQESRSSSKKQTP